MCVNRVYNSGVYKIPEDIALFIHKDRTEATMEVNLP